MPLASVFRTPKEDISAITNAARSHGLYTALMHHPHPNTPDTHVKAESSTATSTSIKAQSSWWVVLGKDAGAVTHLADLHEKNAIGALEFGQRNEKVGAYPPEASLPPTSLGTWLLLLVVVNLLGALSMWLFLAAA